MSSSALLASPTAPSSAVASPADASTSQSSTPSRPRLGRTGSHLRTTPGTLHVPVPPTLANSPLLQSPTSIFRRPHAPPRAAPGSAEELWLRDTVPMGAQSDAAAGAGTGQQRAPLVLPASAGSSAPHPGAYAHAHTQRDRG